MDLGLGIGLVDAAVCQLVRANNADAFFSFIISFWQHGPQKLHTNTQPSQKYRQIQ